MPDSTAATVPLEDVLALVAAIRDGLPTADTPDDQIRFRTAYIKGALTADVFGAPFDAPAVRPATASITRVDYHVAEIFSVGGEAA